MLVTMHNSIHFITKLLPGSVLHGDSIINIKEEKLNFKKVCNIFNDLSDTG